MQKMKEVEGKGEKGEDFKKHGEILEERTNEGREDKERKVKQWKENMKQRKGEGTRLIPHLSSLLYANLSYARLEQTS